jgi:hypothetical protein
VQVLVDSGALGSGPGRALIAKLSTAERHLRHGAEEAGRGELRAFLRQVEAYERARVLGAAQADALEDEARAILDLLGDDDHDHHHDQDHDHDHDHDFR